jgi:hypothetical protein
MRNRQLTVASFVLFSATMLTAAVTQPARATQRRWSVDCLLLNEPGAALSVSPVQVLWSPDEQNGTSTLKDGTATATKTSMTISGTTPTGDEFRGVITKKPMRIGKSNYTTEWTLESNFINNPQAPCTRYSDGMELHQVINVTVEDPLFLRSSPSAKGKALETLWPSSVVMVDPTKRNGEWIRAETDFMHKSKGKPQPLRVVRGWVNSTFIDPQPFH